MKKITQITTFFLLFLLNMANSFAQATFIKTTKPTKIYHEPLAHSAIVAIADPDLDSLQAYKIVTQNNIDFVKIKMLRNQKNAAQKQPKIIEAYGFIALYDLEEQKAADLRKKIAKESFALCKLNLTDELQYSDIKLRATSYYKKTALSNNADKSDFLLPAKTRCLKIQDTAGKYLSATIRHFKPNPDNIYTFNISLQKRNFFNAIFMPSRCRIDSFSESRKFAERQVVRSRDSCIVWFHDRSNVPLKWSGGCKEGFANGDGTLQIDTNRIFKGHLEMGMMQGNGTLRDNAWELQGSWNDGFLTDLKQAHTVLFYKNSPPARDTAQRRFYPTRAPITAWYKQREANFIQKIGSTEQFRRNDILFPYLKESFNLVLPDNENPSLKKYKPTDCPSLHRWKYVGYQRASFKKGDAPFFYVWRREHPNQENPDGQAYYSAADNHWYWWGAFVDDGPFATFEEVVKNICGCSK